MHALQYSMYKHNNANSSRLKTLIRYKIEFKKNMPLLNAITYTKLVSQGSALESYSSGQVFNPELLVTASTIFDFILSRAEVTETVPRKPNTHILKGLVMQLPLKEVPTTDKNYGWYYEKCSFSIIKRAEHWFTGSVRERGTVENTAALECTWRQRWSPWMWWLEKKMLLRS